MVRLLDASDIPLLPRAPDALVPLTPPQRLIWNTQITGSERDVLRLCVASIRILGPLSTDLLRVSLEGLVRRHESLRTRIVQTDGELWQHIDADAGDRLDIVDLTRTSDLDGAAQQLGEEFLETKRDLSTGPLFEGRLLKLSNREHVLILAIDHVVSDATSSVILSREIWSLYDQAARGQPDSLPQLPIQFADYAVWLQHSYEAWLKRHEAYWRKHLAGVRPLRLTRDRGSSQQSRTPTSRILNFRFGKALSARLRDLAWRERTLLPMVVLVVYVIVMSRWIDQRDFVLPFLSHGRDHPKLINMVGFVANFLNLRVTINPEDTFVDLLSRLKLEVDAAYQHKDFNRVMDLIPECNTDLMFNWLPSNRSFDWLPDSLTLNSAPAELRFANLSHQQQTNEVLQLKTFTLAPPWRMQFAPLFADTSADICMTVVYRPDLIQRSKIEQFGSNVLSLAAQFAEQPLRKVGSARIRATIGEPFISK